MRRFHRSLTYANVCATLALFIALSSGASWAAGQLIGGKQIKTGAITARLLAKGSVTSKAVADHSLRAADFATGQLAVGATGATGATGPAGPAAAPGAARVARFVYSEEAGVNALTTFTNERTIGTFTLAAAASIDARWTTLMHVASIAQAGTCVVQLRVDGRTDQGTTPTDDDATVGGTYAVPVGAGGSIQFNIADEAWFPNLTAGQHSLEVWMRATNGVACDEPLHIDAVTTGQAYVTAIG